MSPRDLDRTNELPAATQTVRQRIYVLLRAEMLTAKEISQRASLPERDVAEHLRHLEQSLGQNGEHLLVIAPRCIACGFELEQRHKRPSRCPRCKSERLAPPSFHITT